MLCTISRVEEASVNGDKGVIVVALQKAIAMTIDDWDSIEASATDT